MADNPYLAQVQGSGPAPLPANANPAPSSNPYLDDLKVRANANVAGTAGVEPTQAATALTAAPDSGIPADVGMRTPDETADLAAQAQRARAFAADPKLASGFAAQSPAGAAVAKDSVVSLASLSARLQLEGKAVSTLVGTAGNTFTPFADIHAAFASAWADLQANAAKYPDTEVWAHPGAMGKEAMDVLGIVGSPWAAVVNPAARGLAAVREQDIQAGRDPSQQPGFSGSLPTPSPAENLQNMQSFVNAVLMLEGLRHPGAGADFGAGREPAPASSVEPPAPTSGGHYPVNPEGFVVNSAGEPHLYPTVREAGLAANEFSGPSQVFAQALHPSGEGFAVQDVNALAAKGNPFAGRAGSTYTPPDFTTVGVDANVDAVKTAVAENDAGSVKAWQDELAQAPVHGLSPATTESILSHVTGDVALVDPEALTKLAADGHEPFADLAPTIAEAHATGGQVEVPLSRYLVATAGQPFDEELNAATTFREGGVSQNEAKALGGEAQAQAQPIPVPVAPKDVTPAERPRYDALAAQYTDATQTLFKAQYLAPLFNEAKALGLTKAQLERFSAAIETAKADAVQRSHDRAYAQILAERKPEFTELAKAQAARIAEDLHNLPSVRAFEQLSTKGFKLDRDTTAAFFPEPASRLHSSLTKANGNHPDLAADHVGYDSGAQLVSDLADLSSAIKASGAKSLKGYIDLQAKAGGKAAAATGLGYDLTPEALHEAANELVPPSAIESILSDELRALSAKVGLPLDLPKMRAMAADAFGRLRTADAVNPKRMEKDVWRNGRKALGALQKGDNVRAFQHLQNQFLRRLMLQESFAFAKEAAKALKSYKRFAGEVSIKSMDQGYLNMIHAQLQEHGYSVPQAQMAFDYAQYVAEATAANEPVLPYQPIERGPLKDLSVEGFRDFANRIENLAHLGREAKTILVDGKKQELADLVAEAQAAGAGVPKRPLDTNAVSPSGRATLGSISGMMNSPEVMIDILDDHNPNGVFNRVLMRPARAAAGMDNAVLRPEIEAVQHAVDALKGADWDRWGLRIPEGHGLMDPASPLNEMRLLHQDLVGIALNAGTEHGRWHLEEGGNGWAREAWTAALERHMTPADWDFVTKVAKLLESTWPKVAEGERGLYGVVPERATTDGYTLPSGREVPGHYFPLKRDEARASRMNGPPKVSINELFDHYFRDAATPAGHTKKRTWAKYPVSLDWQNTLGQHLPSVSKRLSYGQFILDANKFLRQPAIAQLVHDVHGPYAMREFESWLHRQVGYSSYDPRVAAGVQAIARELRLRTYAVMTGLKLGIGAEHLTSIAQTMAIAGVRAPIAAYARALAEFLTGPGQTKDFVEASSPYMAARHNSTSRELRDTLDTIRSGDRVLPFATPLDRPLELARVPLDMVNALSAHFFNWINHNLVAVPTWNGVYHDARGGVAKLAGKQLPAMDHAEAVAFADKVIGKSHGSGLELDMSSFQSGGKNELLKLTNMYNVFRGTIAHIAREGIWQAAHARTSQEFLNGLLQTLLGTAGVVMVGKMVTDQLPKKDDPATLAMWAMESLFDGMAHTLPYGDNLYRVGENWVSKKPLDFQVSPSESTIKQAAQGAKDMATVSAQAASGKHGRTPHNWIENAAVFLGFSFGLPLGQPGQTAQVMYDLNSHKRVTQPARALILGPSHENPRR